MPLRRLSQSALLLFAAVLCLPVVAVLASWLQWDAASAQILGEMARTLGLQVAAAEAPPGRSAKNRYALAPEAAALLRADETDTIFYQVLGLRGELLSGDASLTVPTEDELIVPWELHFRDEEIGVERVRVAYLWVSPEGMAGSTKTMLVQVAETLGKRSRLTNEIIKGVILPQFVILPLAVLLVWLALARGIAPLNDLQRRIRSRDVIASDCR